MDSEPRTQLRRVIRLPQASAMVVGTIIGASIFVQPSEITGQVPSLQGALLVWIVSGVLTLFGALVSAQWAARFTRSGGVYVYLKEAFSPRVGFLWGWAMFWVTHSGIIAAVAVIFARYAGFFLPLDSVETRLVAIALILFLSGVNYVGVQSGTMLQSLFTLGKVMAIAAIMLVGFVFGVRPEESVSASSEISGQWSADGFFLAVVAGLFAFGGWHMVTHNSEETVDPERTIPRALVLGTLLVTACYIGLNAVYFYVLPLEQVISSTRVAADAADVLLGSGGGSFMAALVLFSTFGSLSGIVLSGPRVYFSMARDGLLPSWVAAIHPRYRTPHLAIVLQAIWSSLLVATGTYQDLFRRVIYTEWIFFGLMAVGLFALAYRKGTSWKRWGYPVIPALFAAASFTIVGHHVLTRPGESVLGAGVVLLGLAVYPVWVGRKE